MAGAKLTREEREVLDWLRIAGRRNFDIKNDSDNYFLAQDLFATLQDEDSGILGISQTQQMEHYDTTNSKWERREKAALQYYSKAKEKLYDISNKAEFASEWGVCADFS